jgi:hypothetical protein
MKASKSANDLSAQRSRSAKGSGSVEKGALVRPCSTDRPAVLYGHLSTIAGIHTLSRGSLRTLRNQIENPTMRGQRQSRSDFAGLCEPSLESNARPYAGLAEKLEAEMDGVCSLPYGLLRVARVASECRLF